MKARHSLIQTLNILNMEGCNILEGLNNRDYNICIELIKDLVLSTDLSIHLKLSYKQKKICTEFYQNFNSAHRYYLCSLLMTVADLSDFVKDWANIKRITWYLLEEFFKYGDLEKLRERQPLRGMDREHAKIPELLMEFLEEICVPIFNIFTTLFPELESMKFNLNKNLEIWRRLVDYFVEKEIGGVTGLEVLLSDDLDKVVQKVKLDIREAKAAFAPDDEEEEIITKIHEEGSDFSL